MSIAEVVYVKGGSITQPIIGAYVEGDATITQLRKLRIELSENIDIMLTRSGISIEVHITGGELRENVVFTIAVEVRLAIARSLNVIPRLRSVQSAEQIVRTTRIRVM